MSAQSEGQASERQPAEQLRYARWQEWGARLGLALLVLSFALYLSGWLPNQVPVRQLPQVWGLPVKDFLQATGAPSGWHWLAELAHGDTAGLLGIAVLVSCALPALLALLPLYAARRDRIYLLLCLAQAAVVVLAASGWLG